MNVYFNPYKNNIYEIYLDLKKEDKFLKDLPITWKEIDHALFYIQQEIILLSLGKTGSFFGATSMIKNNARLTTNLALTDLYLLVIDRKAFETFLRPLVEKKTNKKIDYFK